MLAAQKLLINFTWEINFSVGWFLVFFLYSLYSVCCILMLFILDIWLSSPPSF